MIKGMVLGKTIWDVDVGYSKFWDTSRYGVSLPRIFKNGEKLLSMTRRQAEPYKFLIATDLWTVKSRIATEHAKNNLGLKIFFIPREALNFFPEFLFNDKRFLHKGKCFLTPDVIFAPGNMYKDQWDDKTKVYVTGHPRFDYCLYDNWIEREKVCKKFDLDPDKKILFYPSTTIFTSKNLDKDKGFKNWGTLFADVHREREMVLKSLLNISGRNDTQVVVKLHPMSSAALRKKGITKDIEGITYDYLKNPTKNFKVIDGKNETRKVARDILTICDYVVGGNSTMMVEAAILKKPVLRVLMGVSKNILMYPGYDDVFNCAHGFNEAVEKMNQMLDQNNPSLETGDIDKYLLMDGKSCEHICNAIKAECK